MSEVYIRSQNKEKLYRLGGNYACVEYGEYEDIKKKRGGAEADKKGNENRAGIRAVIKHGLRLGRLLPALRIFDRKEYRRRYAHGRGTGRN